MDDLGLVMEDDVVPPLAAWLSGEGGLGASALVAEAVS